MQNITLSYTTNPFQQLFVEKGIELLYRNTLDSFRLRLHNPRTIIEELISVCESSLSGILTNNDYVDASSKELKKLLADDHDSLNFTTVSKKHYLSILTKTDRNSYKLYIQSSKLVLKENIEYCTALFDKIQILLNSFSSFIDDGSPKYQKEIKDVKNKLVLLLNHLLVELLNRGYSKQYLYNFFQVIFVRKNSASSTFNEKFEIFKVLGQKADEEFMVIYNIIGNTFRFSEFKKIDLLYERVDKKFRSIMTTVVSTKVNDFLDTHKESNLIYIKINAKDYLKAIEISMDKISKDIDIYHLGFNDHTFKIDSQCAVIGTVDKSKSSTFPSNFQIDGYTRSNSEIFEMLLMKINKIKKNKISTESYDKIISAIRYFRTGSESPELETKFLNYWIGLEYIFTSFNSNEKTIDRIRNYFPKCHGLIYIKRNMFDFHKSIERLKVSSSLTEYDQELAYLCIHKSYGEIVTNTGHELLKFRSEYFQKWFEEPNKIEEAIKQHLDNLQWNLTRLYRIRNEIVHNAAIKNGIYVHISHMKYYLTFILNSILDFMADSHIDINNDGHVTIEDFFVAQEIMFGSVRGTKLSEYLKVNNPSQILT